MIYGLHFYLCVLKNLIFLASEALKIFWGTQKRPNFWILDLWVCLKKLGFEPDLYGKSVLYLGCSLLYRRELWASKSAVAKVMWVCAPAFPAKSRTVAIKAKTLYKPPIWIYDKLIMFSLKLHGNLYIPLSI